MTLSIGLRTYTVKCKSSMQYISVFSFFFSKKIKIYIYILLSIQILQIYSLASESGIFIFTNAKIRNTLGIH